MAAPAIVLHPFPLPPTIHLSSGPLQFACRCVCVHVHDNNNSVINLPEHACVCAGVCACIFLSANCLVFARSKVGKVDEYTKINIVLT